MTLGGGPDQHAAPFIEALRRFAEPAPLRLHIPGHKGGPGAAPELAETFGRAAVEMDIPAYPDIIAGRRAAEELAAAAWGARRTWFVTAGASQANHAVCMALAQRGAEVVVGRNLHSSLIDGLVLSGLQPRFVAPETDAALGIAHGVSPTALDEALAASPAAAGAIVVSPTYYGATADVRGLAEVCHARGVPLVVDEAWGAHLAFHPDLPDDALAAGADLVVSSTHKLVGSMGQSAMLHLGEAAERLIDLETVERALTMLESTSPSALLLGSLDIARRHAAIHGRELLERALRSMRELRVAIGEVEGLSVLGGGTAAGAGPMDPLQLTIDVRRTGASGFELADDLRSSEGVILELASDAVVVAMFGMAEPIEESGGRLVAALSRSLERVLPRPHRPPLPLAAPAWGEPVMTPREAFLAARETAAVDAAVGRVSAEALAVYPPGVPNILPGERLTAENVAYMRQIVEHGGVLHPASDPGFRTVQVVA